MTKPSLLKMACIIFVFSAATVIVSAQTFTTLVQFDGKTNGAHSFSSLVQGTDGNLYGTTLEGGALNGGTVFKMTAGGELTTLYSFCPRTDCGSGSYPEGGLVQGTDGNFYGTTMNGGANGDGSIFEITAAGTLTTLYSFCSQTGCLTGVGPLSGLVQATDGNFYGTATNNLDGAVFKMTPAGTVTTLYSFCSKAKNCGSRPYAVLLQATDGNFYGTATGGGANGRGTIFKITPGGKLTTLYSFTYNNGILPYAGLVQATNGLIYGTTSEGGIPGDKGNDGTVFSLSTGLAPFVETRPTFGKVGATIVILGTDLTGTTSVTFNGTAATFTVVSVSEITALVPAGATTGKVEVTTPNGTLTSNKKFVVKH